ncbi:MAG: glutamate--tRNA ligase [Deltaproteobacteria bacterium]|nr:glutamate--tRNA ligase [Deltaproteobacteria bacterium]
MTAPRIRVRFAPSPTGELHVGNARTALLNWLYARHCGGIFVLRIEDTDRIRTTKAFEENLLADLRWLGIDWDEGPGKGGAFGPYHQTERLALYDECLQRLIAEDRVYPCYCSEAELEAERADLVARRMMPRYLGKCSRLGEAERNRLAAEGRRPVWRFRVEEGPIAFQDLIRGPMTFQGEAIGDFIIVRSNGMPAYNFAVVADDHCMQISHVIRGEDHLSNTAAQVLLYRALGFAPPVFAHHALVLGKDHTKLSKRHGSVSVREFRRRGILPEVLLNTLALLGSASDGGREIVSPKELIAGFAIDRTGRGGAIFDEEKLLWLNGLYIRRYTAAALTDLLLPFVRQAGHDERTWERSRIEAVVAAVQDSLPTLEAIGGFLDLFTDDRFTLDPEAAALLGQEDAKKVLAALRGILAGLPAEEGAASEPLPEFRSLIRSIADQTSLKGKQLYLPIRAAVTGRLHGPELDRIFALLGSASLLKRVDNALAGR